MFDFRHETFLELCKLRSYTKTAERLNMTQPGVTQHIQYLEGVYGGKLFSYQNRTLSLTRRGEKLCNDLTRLKADSLHTKEILLYQSEGAPPLRFGATLTIGEYVMPSILKSMMSTYDDVSVSMQVGNTQVLLQKLRDGEITFALIEGYFDKSSYDFSLLKEEPFISVCSPALEIASMPVTLNDLLPYRLMLRELGSGTREVLEHALMWHSLTVQSFANVCEIGNMSAIKQLVADGYGISFMYRAAAGADLSDEKLSAVNLTDFHVSHEFNFVFRKSSIHESECQKWLKYLESFFKG